MRRPEQHTRAAGWSDAERDAKRESLRCVLNAVVCAYPGDVHYYQARARRRVCACVACVRVRARACVRTHVHFRVRACVHGACICSHACAMHTRPQPRTPRTGHARHRRRAAVCRRRESRVPDALPTRALPAARLHAVSVRACVWSGCCCARTGRVERGRRVAARPSDDAVRNDVRTQHSHAPTHDVTCTQTNARRCARAAAAAAADPAQGPCARVRAAAAQGRVLWNTSPARRRAQRVSSLHQRSASSKQT